MTAWRGSVGRIKPALAVVFAAVILLRSMVPSGYMIDPDAARSGKLAFMLCGATAASPNTDQNDPHAHHHQAHHHEAADQPNADNGHASHDSGSHEGESHGCGLAAATATFIVAADIVAIITLADFPLNFFPAASELAAASFPRTTHARAPPRA